MPNMQQAAKKTGLSGLSQALTSGWRAIVDKRPGKNFFTSPGEPQKPLFTEVDPTQYDYRYGENQIIQPRSGATSSFTLLRTLADSCDLVRIAIENRKEQIRGSSWDIVPVDEDDKTDYTEQIKLIKEFFRKPDRIQTMYQWLGQVIEEILVTDALTLYRRKTRGGELFGLDLVDGTTIKPYVDENGRTPLPPNPAFAQVIGGQVRGNYTIEEMWYCPKNRRTFTVYGFSPVEFVIMIVNLALRRQLHFLNYYTEGTLPDAGLFSVPENWTPDDIKKYQLYFDTLIGKARHKVRFVPDGSYHPTKESKFEPEFEEWLARVITAAFQINPQVLVKQINRATGETQEEIQSDTGYVPMLTFIADIFNEIISSDFKMPQLQFAWTSLKRANELVKIRKSEVFTKLGAFSVDHLRVGEGLNPLGIPPYVLTPGGIVFLTKETVDAMIEAQLKGLTQTQTPLTQTQVGTAVNKPMGGDPNEKQAGQTNQQTKNPISKTAADEIKTWQKFEINQLSNLGKKAMRPFETRAIPSRVAPFTRYLLEQAQTIDDVKLTFRLTKVLLTKAENEEQDPLKTIIEQQLDVTRTRFMEWLNTFKDPKTAVDSIGTFEFIGIAFGDAIRNPLIDGYQVGWNQGKQQLNEIIHEEIELEFPNMVARAWGEQHVGELIVTLDSTTKSMVKETILDSIKNEESWEEIKQKLMDHYALSPARAEVIARTESGRAYNLGAVQSWMNSGIVEMVQVTDGTGDEICAHAVATSPWTLEHAAQDPLGHPNCTREFFPILSQRVTIFS